MRKIKPLRRNTPDRGQLKTLILSTKVDKKIIRIEFSIAICRRTGDKWQLKTLFLAIFDPHSLIVKSVFGCRLSGVRNAVVGWLVLLLYVPSQQLWSLRGGQFT